MLYLAGQFAWFLLAAFGVGCVMGWVAQSSRKARFWSPAWTWVAVLWGLAAALVWFQQVNGRLATWLETALLFVAVYWAGCVLGALSGSVALARPASRTAPPAQLPQPATAVSAAEPLAGSEPAKEKPADAATTPEAPAAKPAAAGRQKPKG